MTLDSTTRRALLKAAAAAPLLSWWPLALAQAFPSRSVRIITAFGAGSGPDTALRVVGRGLEKAWKQPVVIENKPGGSGFIAYDAFRQSAADGHVLIQLDSNHLTTHPHVFSKLPYDPQKDLEPVRPLFRNYFFVVVAATSPIRTLDDLVAAARKAPGKINYGSWGNGSPGHLGALLLQSQMSLEMVHVPFKGMAQLYSEVGTQDVDWALGSAASAGPIEKAGHVRFIAVAAPLRMDTHPQAPATGESASTRGYEVRAWTGLFAPRGTPLALRERIANDIAQVLATPEAVERWRGLGYLQFDADPKAFAQAIAAEARSWAGVIRAFGLKLD